jgi:acyl-CoA synthetase (NDP forming)
MVRTLRAGKYPGTATVVNPSLPKIEGMTTVGRMTELQAAPDLAILSVSSPRMEETLGEAIRAGAKSAVIFDFCQIEHDTDPPLVDRLRSMAREAGIPVCGGNGMGFYNFDARCFVSFQEPTSLDPGHIALLCHSGSVFGMFADAAGRYGFNLITAQGQEINGTVADYMDYALEQPTTRVVALFAEAIRDPAGFVAALEKAAEKGIPVVVLKVGRTAASARFAVTHSGAMAGDNAAFEALCDRYGVLRVDDLDGLMAAAQMLALDTPMRPGELGSLLDSGGLRELMLDLADDLGVPFAELAPTSVDRLSKRIYFALEPANPLDAAGPYTSDLAEVMGDCLDILAEDEGVAGLVHEFFNTDLTSGVVETIDIARRMPGRHPKPYAVSYALGAAPNSGFAAEMRRHGVPLLAGMRPMLVGMRAALQWRDFRGRAPEILGVLDQAALEHWRGALSGSAAFTESKALHLLADLGVPATPSEVGTSAELAVQLAERIGYPVAVKTAAPGILHKSDSGGVHLNLNNADEVRNACDDLARLGPEVAVSAMASPGVEVAFGMINDPQFGPVVMVSAGGTMIEILDDRVFARAPFGEAEAERMLRSLKIWKLLQGARGRPKADIAALTKVLSRFSVICGALRDRIAEFDVNPVIASPDGVKAVDAVLVPFQSNESSH